ncbi:hypothetical protein PENTCL1PPCAC_30203, partial [Pristionchus entomophagus]
LQMWSTLYAQAALAAASPPPITTPGALSSAISTSALASTALSGCSSLLSPAIPISQPVLRMSRPEAASSTAATARGGSSSMISPKSSAASEPDDSDSDRNDPIRHKFWCNHCQKDFRRSDMLSRHIRRHTGEKPFQCDCCHRYFSRRDHLHTHRRTHADVKPYTCSLCSYAARRQDVLTRHMATRHQANAGQSIFQKGE